MHRWVSSVTTAVSRSSSSRFVSMAAQLVRWSCMTQQFFTEKINRIALLVRVVGFEPTRITPQDPKSCASANSAIPARCGGRALPRPAPPGPAILVPSRSRSLQNNLSVTGLPLPCQSAPPPRPANSPAPDAIKPPRPAHTVFCRTARRGLSGATDTALVPLPPVPPVPAAPAAALTRRPYQGRGVAS